MSKPQIPISVSVRHVHLSRTHVEALFGAGHRLTPRAELSQPGQFACDETLTLRGPKAAIDEVRVLGPERAQTQVEISRSDEYALGIDAPIRRSGQLDDTPGLTLIGPAGELTLRGGVIQAMRHIHMHPDDAEVFAVRDGQIVMVRVLGPRGIIFDDVLVRVKDSYALDMHIDTDEGNAAEIVAGTMGELIGAATLVQAEPDD